tara:strand:+ start:1139 stop:1579 length:441 start_codon:yes stop_codon:yes gene_type:complete
MKQLKKSAMLIGEFTQLFNGCSIAPQERKAVMTLGIARYVGYECELPTSEVHNTRTYFLETHKHDVDAFLSSLNEQFVIDVAAASDLAFKIWTTRYNLVFHPRSLSLETLMSMHSSKTFSDVEYKEKWNTFAVRLGSTLANFTQAE